MSDLFLRQFLLSAVTMVCGASLSQSLVWMDSTETLTPTFYLVVQSDKVKNEDGSLNLERCKRNLSLRTISDGNASNFSIEGNYEYKDSVLSYQPLFKLDSTIHFELKYNTSLSLRLTLPIKKSAKCVEEVKITKVYPNSTKIPNNIMAFYVEFDRPMVPIDYAYKHFDLVVSNKVVDNIWRQRSYWINDNTTLVLMIHPGRVKSGIQSTNHLKKHFTTGDVISLKIREQLMSVDGNITYPSIIKSYEIGVFDKKKPKLKRKKLKHLKVESRIPIQLSFSEPMDYGVLQKWIKIRINGKTILGNFLSTDDITWKFVPDKEWKGEKGEVIIPDKLSDLSRNQLDRLFETSKENDFKRNSLNKLEFKISQ